MVRYWAKNIDIRFADLSHVWNHGHLYSQFRKPRPGWRWSQGAGGITTSPGCPLSRPTASSLGTLNYIIQLPVFFSLLHFPFQLFPLWRHRRRLVHTVCTHSVHTLVPAVYTDATSVVLFMCSSFSPYGGAGSVILHMYSLCSSPSGAIMLSPSGVAPAVPTAAPPSTLLCVVPADAAVALPSLLISVNFNSSYCYGSISLICFTADFLTHRIRGLKSVAVKLFLLRKNVTVEIECTNVLVYSW